MGMIGELHRSGRTVLLITHDPAIAAAAPRRVSLRDGRIVSDEGAARRAVPAGAGSAP